MFEATESWNKAGAPTKGVIRCHACWRVSPSIHERPVLFNTYTQEGYSREDKTIDQRGNYSAVTDRSARKQQ